MGDGKAESRSLVLLGHAVISSRKGFENLFKKLLRHTDAVILHLEAVAALFARFIRKFHQAHADPAALRRTFHSVGDKVDKHLAKAHRIALDVLVDEIDLHPEILFLFPSFRRCDLRRFVHQLFQGNPLAAQFHPATLDFGHIKDIVDEA